MKHKVLVFGTFDLLHAGHIRFLMEAKKLGSLIVIVARDENVKKIKGRLPEHDIMTRIRLLNETGIPDKIIKGKKDDWFSHVYKISPDIICLGYDQDSLGIEKHTSAKIIRLPKFGHHKSSGYRKKYQHF